MRPHILSFVAIATLLTGCGGAVSVEITTDNGATVAPPEDETALEATVEVIAVPVGSLGTEHIDPPALFSNSPSIGGDHYPFWQNCGFYNVELLEGAATHTMEHGAVWITYNADKVDSAELDVLAEMAEANGKLLISPYSHDEKLVLSAWGIQHRTAFSPTDPEVAAFVAAWIDNPELAEAGVRCTGAAGIPPNDTRTLSDGATVSAEYN